MSCTLLALDDSLKLTHALLLCALLSCWQKLDKGIAEPTVAELSDPSSKYYKEVKEGNVFINDMREEIQVRKQKRAG